MRGEGSSKYDKFLCYVFVALSAISTAYLNFINFIMYARAPTHAPTHPMETWVRDESEDIEVL